LIGSEFRHFNAVNRAKDFASPAGYTIISIFDNGLPGILIHTKHILGTNADAYSTAVTDFLVYVFNSH
jgi:hypothetical protein